MELAASALALGKVVGQRAGKAWLISHTAATNRDKKLVELIQVGFVDQIHGRRVKRQLDEISDLVAERVLSLCGQEYRDLQDSDKASAVAEVKETLEEADLSDEVLFLSDMDAAKLAIQIRAQSPNRGKAKQLGEAGARIYEIVLVDTCDCLLRIVRELAPFSPRAIIEVLSRLSELSERVNSALTRLPVRNFDAPEGEADDENFKRRYLEAISHNLDSLELFGVRIERYRPRTSLSVSYISLKVSAGVDLHRKPKQTSVESRRPFSRQDDINTAHGNLRVETALGRSRLTLIRGEAGSGKSTVLRWLAIAAARGSFSGDLAHLKGYTPFLVKLRSYADGRLPRPEELLENVIGVDLSLMPTGWIHRRLASGRSMLLVDGVDELKASQRKNVRDWLEALLSTYPEIHVVITSRPAAADAKWLNSEGFSSVYLERMSPNDVKRLIRHWHDAARDMIGLPCDPERLPGYESALLARLETTPHLRVLATSPLLAAMLCALNLDHETHLPRDRMGLYSATIEMLLSRRDTQRNIAHEAATTVDQAVHILQDIAWRLSQSNRSELSRELVLRRVADRLATMPLLTESPTVVLNSLLERSGVLREPVIGRIDFVHRSVQEYLAAKQIADDSDMEILIAGAHQDQWYETIVMVAGHANSSDRATLIKGLLDRAESEPKYARRIKLLVAASLETLQSVEPALRKRIEACLSDLIPPQTAVAAYSLATVGEYVLDRLPENLAALRSTQACATVRATYLINGPQALDRLVEYSADPRATVQREIVAGWEYFDPEIYAQRVLSQAPLDNGGVAVSSRRLMPYLHHIANMTNLFVGSRAKTSDLDFLSNMPNRLHSLSIPTVESDANIEMLVTQSETLKSLYLDGGHISGISILARMVKLTNLALSLDGCDSVSFLEGLAGLKGLTLSDLSDLSSFGELRECIDLYSLHLTKFPALTSVDELPAAPGLTRLSLYGTGLSCSLDEIIERYPRISSLGLNELQSVQDLSAITAVNCHHLTLFRCAGVVEISPLRSQKRLWSLDLEGTGVEDLSPISELSHLTDLDISNCLGIRDLSPLSNLSRLRRLSARGMPGIDLTPLAALDRLNVYVDVGQDVVGGDEFGRRLYRFEKRSE